jgi:hypothetical protein
MRCRFALAALLLAGCSAGCGYSLAGRGVTVDPTIKRVGVPLFRDKTGKPDLDRRITQRVIEELLRRGRLQVVSEADNVDAIVDGEILSYVAVPVAYGQDASSGTNQVSRYTITITAKVTYSKVGEKAPIWSQDAFSFREDYELGDDPATFFDRETQGIDRMAQAFAKSLVAAMLEAF